MSHVLTNLTSGTEWLAVKVLTVKFSCLIWRLLIHTLAEILSIFKHFDQITS